MIRILSILGFLACAVFSLVLGFYLFILGMAPGLSPLSLPIAGVFLYGPGPGFLLLLLWWCVAVIVFGAALLANRFGRPHFRRRGIIFACITLAGLLVLQLVMIADFQGIV